MAKKPTIKNHLSLDENRPFLGLRSFEEKNKSQFGGRDDEIIQLFSQVEGNGLTVVFGTSGIGKTSLLKAGLMPKLRQELYFPIYIRIDYSSSKPPVIQMRDLVYETMKKLDPDNTPIGSGTLWEYLHAVDALNELVTPVLIFDQFEEIFTLGKTNKGVKEFVEELATIAQNRIPFSVKKKYRDQGKTVPSRYSRQPYRVVISLREDYLARLDELKKYIPSIMDDGFRVVQMTISQAMQAAIKPGKGLISEEVAVEIIKILPGISQADFDLLKTHGDDRERLMVEPFLLSLICDRLNEKRIKKKLNIITSELAAQFKVDDVIASFYDDTIKEYDKKVDLAIQNELLDAEGYRKLHTLNEFQSVYKITDDEIGALVSARIVRKEHRNNVDYLELIHDVLAPVIKKKRDKRLREEREALRRLKIAKQEAEREAAILKEKEDIKKRNKRRAAVFLPIAIIIAGVAIFSSRSVYLNKERVEGMAKSRYFLNSSKSELSFSLNRVRAAQLSLDAYKLFVTHKKPEAGDYIFEELYYNGLITSYHKLFRGRGKNIFEIDTTRREKNLPKNKTLTNPINTNNAISQNVNLKIFENKKNIDDVPSFGVDQLPIFSPLGNNEAIVGKALKNTIGDHNLGIGPYQSMITGMSNESYYIGTKLGKIKRLNLKKDSVNYKIDSIFKSPDIRRVHSMAFKNNLLAIASTTNIIDIYDVIKKKSLKKVNIPNILETDSIQYIYSFGFSYDDELLILNKERGKEKKKSIIKWNIESETLSNWDTINHHHFWKWNDSLIKYDYDKLEPSDSRYLKLGGTALSIPKVDREGKKTESFKDLFFISPSPDSKVAVGILNGLLIIKENECYEIENLKFGNITVAKFNPNGKYLIMGNDRGQVYAVKFNFEKNAKAKDIIETVELPISHTSKITNITFSPNNSSFGKAEFATADAQGLVVKWKKDNKYWSSILIDYKLFKYKSELGEVVGMAFSKKGEFLTVVHGDKNNTIIRWPATMNTIDSLMSKKLKEIDSINNIVFKDTKVTR